MTRTLYIGDSILEGMSRPLFDIYLRILTPSVDFVKMESRSGWSTRRWLREGDVLSIIKEFKPTTVVIALGTNDEGEQDNQAGYKDVVRRLAGIAGRDGAQVLWIAAFTGTGIQERFKLVREVVGANAIDGSSLMSGVSMANAIHPNQAGYETLAMRVVEQVIQFESTKSEGGSTVTALLIGLALGFGGMFLWEIMR